MAPNKIRIVLLCEDGRQESLVRPICEARFGSRVRVQKEGASDKVIRRYPIEVKALRSKGAERVGLVVVIDGDNRGVKRRKEDLADALAAAKLAPVASEERIAVCVPTWSIETWLVALSSAADVDESKSFKRDWEKRRDTKRLARVAVGAWRDHRVSVMLPSFLDASDELARLA